MAKKLWHQAEWAKSADGLPISIYASRPIDEIVQHAPILFVGGVHGDEPEGVALAEDWLAWLTQNNCLNDWVLIPCINPDGYHKLERTNGNGVDLNRNFPSRCWSGVHDEPRYFPGIGPASEPETKALVHLVEQITPVIIIHFHSWEPSIVYTNDKAKWAAERLSMSSGYHAQPDIGYPTPGSLGEYGGKDLGIGVICIEEQEGEPLTRVFPKFKQGLIDIIHAKSGQFG
ncbi:DUF2817 domain-containing protein [Thalassotalea euphylliae]|uniref:DUF2817 domain-containing protein n=1 Tax=Thalassotalea euphylliae TaxID=1655234 RepID=UPI003640BBE3